MGTTARGITYPEATGLVRDGDNAMQSLAETADTAIGAAITAHTAAGDPHPSYMTSAEAAALVTAHEAAADPHPTYLRTAQVGAASGAASLDSNVKLVAAQIPSSVPAVARHNGTSWPTRASITSDLTRPVMWTGPATSPPPVDSTYARSGVDLFIGLP